jgi:single-stranded-DNA-specific exonuclease
MPSMSVARMLSKKWMIRPADSRSERLAAELGVSPTTAQLLINRGLDEQGRALSFLRPKLNDLIEPTRMPGIGPALERLKTAIQKKEKITIYGDYDVDGITGVSILWQLLCLLGADVDYYIPHRIDEGYGLNTDAITNLAGSGSKVIVTVDCGITACQSAELAKKLGVDLIITDHHTPGSKLPPAIAIVHPAIDALYPNQDSSGAMVAFKLAWATAGLFNNSSRLSPELRDFMLNAASLAAMGTVADIVDLRGENRILTSYGLKSLPNCKMPGIQALIEIAQIKDKRLDSFDIGFRLAPMLNAAGRMGHARLAVELLTGQSSARSMEIAEYLKSQNEERQRCERKIFKQACEMVLSRGLNHPDNRSIVLCSPDWHIGVIGIVASRLVDKFHRPTVLLSRQPDSATAQGSARSVPGFCVLSAIKSCAEHLVNFGGHRMAAGLTARADRFNVFVEDFEKYTRQKLSEADLTETIHIDALTELGRLKQPVVSELQLLAPFGEGNPAPLFATKGLRLAGPPKRVGVSGDHLQLVVTDNTATMRCIGFGMGRLEKKLLEQDFFNAVYQPQINLFNGNSNVELIIEDIQTE